MKHTFVKFTGKKIFTTLFFATALCFMQPLKAANTITTKEFVVDGLAGTKLSYTGSESDSYNFAVKVANPDGSRFVLSVEDENGNRLYASTFNDKDFSRRIKLLKNPDVSTYVLTISSTNKNLSQSFVISTFARTIDEVSVTKR